MVPRDLDQVMEIESASFASPWNREHFLYEMRENRYAETSVVESSGRVVAYACVWHLHGELKINNVAVASDRRRRGLGRWLMRRLFDRAVAAGCRTVDLEVRSSNAAALALYRELGLVASGRRKNYYAIEGEDAIVMRGELPAPDASDGEA